MRNKKVKGFTLIELIVVIAIIAVLAAILIPSLMGWVAKSSLRTANTNAKAVATNGAAVLADLEVQGVYLSDDFSAEGEPTYNDDYVVAQVKKLAGFKDTNKWGFFYDSTSEKVTVAYWAENEKSPYIGSYPEEAKKKGTPGTYPTLAGESKTPSGGSGGGNNGGNNGGDGGGDNSEG